MSRLLQDWVTSQAERRPDSVALVMNNEEVTYGQLETASNQLARVLKAAGCKKGDRVCFLVPKSPTAIMCILGILKADCIYVPLDTASPVPRTSKVLESCQNRWILAAGPVKKRLDELLSEKQLQESICIGWLEQEGGVGKNFKARFWEDDLQNFSSSPLDYQNTNKDPAYILFTSGSTGNPKGVVITHDNVIHFIKWANRYFNLCPSDRISGHSPLHFDLSVFDIFGALAAGAQLHLVPPELNLLPNKLVNFIRTSELTQWFSVPSVLNYMVKFDVVQFKDFPTLRRLLWCGEVFSTPALIYWMKRLPHVSFTNLYGPTEATIASSYYTIPACPEDTRATIPIGRACEGEELLVLDNELQPVPHGEIGELYISGVGLSPGYWKDPEKTRSAFYSNPNKSEPNGRLYKTGDLAELGNDCLIYFHGRADFQIKSRGYRIELGEIETALNSMDCLQECAVVAFHNDGFEGATICCAYVRSPDLGVTAITLRKELSKLLPNYMLPSRWMCFDRLPKNANGKIDRRKLKERFEHNESQKHVTF